MRRQAFLAGLLLIFLVEIAVVAAFAFQDMEDRQDAVMVNEVVHSIQEDWNTMEIHRNKTELDYVVLDESGAVLFGTRRGLSESINAAVLHRDTILDLQVDGLVVGKIIIYNKSMQLFQSQKRMTVLVLAAAMLIQCCICIIYYNYLNHTIVKPFCKLKGFAERVAGGNLDIPLEMDRQNLFGAFTESFDIMRSELKKARLAKAKADASKKELVAKLSHDIKTPVASIKAASEVGAALTSEGRIKDNYMQIIRKSDQINTLVTNLFTAALEELEQLSVTPKEIGSGVLKEMLESADYLRRAKVPVIPECMLYADKLRLQQVFDNIFANSYKYADTKIAVKIRRKDNCLNVSVEDYGGGVSEEELPLLKEKFGRGNNGKDVEGAGLGLYISDYFMKEMHGKLDIQNGEEGLKVVVGILLSGKEEVDADS